MTTKADSPGKSDALILYLKNKYTNEPFADHLIAAVANTQHQ